MAESPASPVSATLDGPREQFETLLRDYENASFNVGEWDSDSPTSLDEALAEQTRARESLFAFVSGLLADAALLDRITRDVPVGGSLEIRRLNATTWNAGMNIHRGATIAALSFDRPSPREAWASLYENVDRLSRALPEGGV